MSFKNYLKELKRRNVLKASLAYIVASWIIIQVMSIILPTIGAPEYIMKLVLVILIVGFPFWAVFSWVYEITAEGLKKTSNVSSSESVRDQTNSRLNKVIIGALVIAIGLLIYDVLAKPSVKLNKEVITEHINNDKSIAVLAFADMSPDKDQEYFSDGISEEILNLLAKIQDLKVISRTSAFSFKGTNTTAEEIGKKLDVAHVLEGSIRKSGNTLRITTQLIRTEDGSHIWSETYDRELEDVFEIQDEIADHVTEKLKTTILGEELKTQKVDTEAYNLYLRAKALKLTGREEDNENAIRLLRRAIEIEPSFSLAWVELNITLNRSIANHGTRPISFFDSTMVIAKKAVELDRNSAMAYSAVAYNYFVLGNDQEAIKYSKRALSLNSNLSDPNNIYGLILRDNGEVPEALTLFKKVGMLDPVRTRIYKYNIGMCYEMLGMFDEAIMSFSTIIDEGEHEITLIRLGEIAAVQGNTEDAIEYANRLLRYNRNTLNLSAAADIAEYVNNDELAKQLHNEAYSKDDFDLLTHPDTALYIARSKLNTGATVEGHQILDELERAIYEMYGTEGDYYYDTYWNLLAIESLRNNTEKALELTEELVDSGFLWYRMALLDKNLETILSEPKFIEIMNSLKDRVVLMRNEVQLLEAY